MKDQKWYDKLLLIADFIPPNPNELEKFDVEKQVKCIKELKFNSQHIEATDVTVGEAGIHFFKSEGAVSQRRDLLQEYCINHNLKSTNALIYFNVHWLAEDLCMLKPEWYQRNSDFEKIAIGYGSGGVTCINSDFRDWAFNAIKDQARYDIKGVFLDGPFFHPDGCYCNACLSKFEEMYGFRYTAQNLKNIEVFRKLIDFRKYSVEKFMFDAQKALKSVNQEAIIYMNSIQISSDIDGRDNNLTIKWQDALLAEGGFLYKDLRAIPIWKPAATAKLLESQADGKPCIVAIAGRLGPWSRYLLPSAENWIVSAETVAYGANIWYGIYDSNRDDARMKTVKDINAFLSANENYLVGTKPTAKIALVWSFKNADFYQSTSDFVDFTGESNTITNQMKSDARKAFNGWCEVLHCSHRLFDIIDDYYINNKEISKYDLLILPGIACMSQEEIEIVKSFVKKGGHIITTFDTSFYNEYGVLQENIGLNEVLGISTVEGVEDLPADHIAIEDSWVTYGINQPLIPASDLYIKVNPCKSAKPMMSYRVKQTSRYCNLPPKTRYPLLVSNDFGKGKTVMFTGNMDVTYDAFHLPEHFTMMSNAIDSLSKRELFVDDKLTSLDINVRRKGSISVIHLINHTSYSGRPINEVIPLKDVKLAVCMVNKPVSVRTLRSSKVLEFSYENGKLTVTVPEINEYEIVLCE